MEWNGAALYPLPMHEAHERHLRAALVADGLVSRAALRHGCLVQAALTSELGTPSLGAVLVDLGYLEERALVSRVASIVRAPVWDGLLAPRRRRGNSQTYGRDCTYSLSWCWSAILTFR